MGFHPYTSRSSQYATSHNGLRCLHYRTRLRCVRCVILLAKISWALDGRIYRIDIWRCGYSIFNRSPWTIGSVIDAWSDDRFNTYQYLIDTRHPLVITKKNHASWRFRIYRWAISSHLTPTVVQIAGGQVAMKIPTKSPISRWLNHHLFHEISSNLQ